MGYRRMFIICTFLFVILLCLVYFISFIIYTSVRKFDADVEFYIKIGPFAFKFKISKHKNKKKKK